MYSILQFDEKQNLEGIHYCIVTKLYRFLQILPRNLRGNFNNSNIKNET